MSVDLLLGTLPRIAVFLLHQCDQLVFLARDLLKVGLGELVPPPFELPPDLQPLLGKALWTHAHAVLACRLSFSHARSSVFFSRLRWFSQDLEARNFVR